MTVYVIACTDRKWAERKPHSIFELWTLAIAGPYDHVEIAVIRDSHVYGFWLTSQTKYATYGLRPDNGLKTKYSPIDWYLLETMSVEEELELISRCTKLSRYGERTFHAMKMMMSGFPIPDPDLASRWLRLLDPRGGGEGEEATMRLEGLDDPSSSYCAAACAEVLGFADFDTMTANDLVEACKVRFKARVVKDPIPEVHTSVRDPANILRSRFL